MNTDPHCPICGKFTNSKGVPFSSDWAVALHIAASSKADSRLHTSWILSNSNLSKNELRDLSNNDIAERILYPLEASLQRLETEERNRITPASNHPFLIIKELEKKLHNHIRNRLILEYSEENENWWYEGVPDNIRIKCATRHQSEREDQDLYLYTDFIDLKDILNREWRLFEGDFAPLKKVFPAKKDFLGQLEKLNKARNRHSHVRSPEPGTQQYEADLDLAIKMAEPISIFTAESSEEDE